MEVEWYVRVGELESELEEAMERIAELEAENRQLLDAYRKRGVEIARLRLENDALKKADTK